jgi:AAA+ superfamily predicted ATPase
MKLRGEIEQISIEVCKRHSHAEVTELHVLRALQSKVGTSGTEISTKLIDKELDKIPVVRNAKISIGSRASKYLELLDDEDPLKIRDDIAKSYFKPPELNISGDQDPKVYDAVDSDFGEGEIVEDVYKPSPKKVPIRKSESLESVLEELNSLIGLKKAKEQVNSFIAVHKANKIRMSQNLPPIAIGLHLVFTGSPGTGKTTVARLIGRLYKAIGLLDSGELIEVDRSDLIAGFVGQTALKTQMKIVEAEGGVLFIDEAYSLSSDTGSEHGFGDEAISTLVKAMEDKRDKFAVIVAGYSEDMDFFIKSNKGLKSRFQTFIEFEDYNVDELVEIFKAIAKNSQVALPPDVENAIREYVLKLKPSGEDGNGRFARNLFEKMFQNLTTRAMSDGTLNSEQINTFAVPDVPDPSSRTDKDKDSKISFGFS